MTVAFEYRLVYGWVSSATLDASDATALENWPLAWDQPNRFSVPWLCIDDEKTTYPDYRRETQNAAGGSDPDGDIYWTWSMKYLTEGMQYYAEEQLMFGVRNPQVTVRTRIKTAPYAAALFNTYQAYLTFPPRNASSRIQGGALDIPWNFYGATLISGLYPE